MPMPNRDTHKDMFEKCINVRFEGPYNTTSINNRFLPIKDVPRDSAIFSVDDDVLVSCDSLMFAFEVISINFYPRPAFANIIYTVATFRTYCCG